jgi:hypothetical protein
MAEWAAKEEYSLLVWAYISSKMDIRKIGRFNRST